MSDSTHPILNRGARMDWLKGRIKQLRALVRKESVECELDEEIGFHLEMEIEKLIHEGLSPEAARRRARLAFGGVEHYKEVVRETRWTRWLEDVGQDLRYAARSLRKRPGFTAVAVLTLALGIGANAAIFSLFDQLLLRPLPVREPERLVNLAAQGPKPGSQTNNQAGGSDAIFSYPMFRDLQREQTVFTGIAAHRAVTANLAYRGQTLNGVAMFVSGSYFPVLGLQPALGHLLGPGDDRTIGGHFVAVLSHRYWRTHLGASADVLEQTIVVNGRPMTIVGVAPRGFEGTTLGVRPEVFVPITMLGLLSDHWGGSSAGFDGFDDRRSYWAYLFARLKSGVSMEQAATGINAVYRPIINQVEAPLQEGMSDQTMARFRAKEITLEEGARGQSTMHASVRTPLILLFSITGIVLLIACANLANLLLARAATRSMEMATRLSLGASRSRVMTQLLTESSLLAVFGGLASLVIAHWTLAGFGIILPAGLAAMLELELQPSVMAFAGALAIGTGLLFGIFPALHSTRPDLITTIRGDAEHPSGARAAARFRASLVTGQFALSMALLVLAGLFTRSLANISRVDLGMRVENVVTFGISPKLNGYEPAQSFALFERVEEALAALPGVTHVAASRLNILTGRGWGTRVQVEGFEAGPDTWYNRYNEIGPGYFRTLGIPLLAGRRFTPADNASAPRVAIVNETFARKFNLGRDVVGRYMALGGQASELDIEIVGLVQDANYHLVKQEVPPQFFLPYRQDEEIGAIYFYTRTALEPEALLDAVPRVISTLDPNLPVEDLEILSQQVRDMVSMDRTVGTLSAAFAALATLLAAVGLYGVLAYTVARRRREIGVRMALGASGGRVQRMVLRQVGLMTVVGGAIGVAAALALGRAARSLLFEVGGYDPLTIAIAAVVLGVVALGAGYLPARRASAVDPMAALRYD